MISIIRATAILGSSSVVSILVGLVSAKALAVLIGPSGLGYLSLLQALLGLSLLVAGMGVGTGLIRMGANALAREDQSEVAALHRAIWLLLGALGGIALLVMITFREPISQAMLGGTEHATSVVVVAVALLFSLASSLQTSLLNTYHRIGALAKVSIANTVLGTACTLVLVLIWREEGITPAILTGSVVGWLISTYFLRRASLTVQARASRSEVLATARSLLRFGVPYTGSVAVGTGVQFVLPAVILHTLGAESVGFHRAATSISGVYLGFLLTAMGQDYYPRISAVSDKRAALIELVNQQHRVVMLLAVPMILGTLALAPYIVPLIYTSRFSVAVEILEWQLIGDLFKFSSWTMGFVILARARSVTLFFVELLAGLNMLILSWFGIQWFGIGGLGIAFLLTYVVHYAVVFIVVRHEIGFVWTRGNVRVFLAAVLAAFVIRALPWLGLEHLRTPVALSLAVLAGSISAYVIWREAGGLRNVRAWL